MIQTITAQDSITQPIVTLCNEIDNLNQDVEIVYQSTSGNAYTLSVKRFSDVELAMFNSLKASIKANK